MARGADHRGALQLRVKDVDFGQRDPRARGLGGKYRDGYAAASLAIDLRDQFARNSQVWSDDVAAAQSGVELPYALERKYPRAGTTWASF
jgi:hypothetical protein